MKKIILTSAITLLVGYVNLNASPTTQESKTPFSAPRSPYQSTMKYSSFNTPKNDSVPFEESNIKDKVDANFYKQFMPLQKNQTKTDQQETKKTIKLKTDGFKKISREDLERLANLNDENFRLTDFFVNGLYYTIEKAPSKKTFDENKPPIEKITIALKKEGEAGPELNVIVRGESKVPTKIEYSTTKENPKGWVVGEIVSVGTEHGYDQFFGQYIVKSIRPIQTGGQLKTTTWYRLEPLTDQGKPFSLVYEQNWNSDQTLSDSADWPTSIDIDEKLSSTWRRFFDYFTKPRTPGMQ